MLKEIAERGDQSQRKWAMQTLTVSEQLRGRRLAIGGVRVRKPAGEKHRIIYDAANGYELPGTLVRSEGDSPSSDTAVNEAYDGAGATYDLFKEVFGRNSIDNRGMQLDSTVHYAENYDNAFWDGRQMVYGDGDGKIFERFTKAVDVITHELSHGVTQYEANLIYQEQSGALNESFSDVFGSLVKQRLLGQRVEQANWLVGEGLFKPGVKGVAIRSMKAPGTAYDDPVLGKDPQPGHMKDYNDTWFDNGGVHINSGIPNHAFYLVAIEIGGYAWEKAGLIWYVALRDRIRRRANFKRAAKATFRVAGELFGVGSREQEAVRKGWEGVGVTFK
jgi:Zn-dependent metalloprotease